MNAECPAWAPPLLAVQFLTRVPVPGVGRLSEAAVRVGLGRAVAWFPLVGGVVGSITAGTLLLTEHVWPRLVAVILALIVETLITGAFHEDAVADFCDGVGGGRDPEHVRQIMKDSRIGSYGALGLTLGVSLRAALMYAVAEALTLPAIVAAATLARLTAVVVMATTPPAPTTVRGTNIAASPLPHATAGVAANGQPHAPTGLARTFHPGIRPRDVVLAFAMALPGLLPFALAAPLHLLCAVLATTAFLVYFRMLLMRRVGGTTGDCLGFAVYATQLILLLAATAW
jgi:adenosylcobinamide-GDP ribazoletransferase